ncbi:hypothetical protein PG984_016514 [Apiospora sp. TS-2023a]
MPFSIYHWDFDSIMILSATGAGARPPRRWTVDWVYSHHAMPVEYGWSMLRRRQVTTDEAEPEPCVAGPSSRPGV